ncbi:MAG: SUMF1/EgtB/PvdO family nonheme iron enzyme [Anaerolineae bacterium]|nr:SUMF1/EgtB/PvdO family nonheme iron enzyme [Anaerolineae bacterium]
MFTDPIAAPTHPSLLDQLDFLPVPSGVATLGLDDKVAERFLNSYGEIWKDFFCRERPQHAVSIEAFDLARYPVTNGFYARFMAAGGYDNPAYWTPEGWAWRVRTGRTRPLMWGSTKFAGDNRPVVGVSWYEALALACWAAIETGANIRLPTEAEWEWAARGTNIRSLYPWGGAWDAAKLNSGAPDPNTPSHGTTTPVGTYSPAGDGPFGHGDLLGQVWEWTNSAFKAYPYVETDGREDRYSPERRVLRGGNWSDGKYANRATTRYLYEPHYSDITTGVRLARGGSRPPMAAQPAYDLIVYGRSTFCPDLVKAKQWLHAWNVPYHQLNVDMHEAHALRLDEWLGSRTVPTLVVAKQGEVEPITPPTDVDLSRLRNMDRGSMLHEPDEPTLRAFLVRHGFLKA